jgi:predicted nucleotidyltransferase
MLERIDEAAFDAWAREAGIEVVYHHGSTATGRDKASSDIDVALLIDNRAAGDWKNVERIRERSASQLGRLFGVDSLRVDVQILNQAPLAFQYRVIGARRPLWEVSRARRIEYERDLMREYLDFRYYEDIHNEAMRRRIQEGRYGRRQTLR